MYENIYVYANLKADLNNADNEASEMASIAQSVGTKLSVAISFEAPELLGLSTEKLNALKNAPELSKYKHYLDSLSRSKEHVLSEKEEALISTFSELSASPEEIYSQAAFEGMFGAYE